MDAVIGGTGSISNAVLGYGVSITATISISSCSPSSSQIAEEVWRTTLPAAYTTGKAGKFIGSDLLTLVKFLGLK